MMIGSRSNSITFIFCLVLFFINQVSIHASTTVVYQKDIDIDGKLYILSIQQDQEPIDVVYEFRKQHGLDLIHQDILMNDVCKKILCKRYKAKLWSTNVNQNDAYIGRFELYEGIEPVDAAQEFIHKYNLTLGYRHAILEQACKLVECTRLKPMVWEKSINIGNEIVQMTLLEGEELADKIFEIMIPYKISHQDRQQIMATAKMDGIVYQRENAILFSKEIYIPEENFNQTLVVLDNGREPIDILYEFVKTHKIEHMLNLLSEKVLPHTCNLIICSRSIPVVWSYEVMINNHFIGNVEVMKNEEPVDAVDRFARSNGLTGKQIMHLINTVCEKTPCSRERSVVYRKRVNDEHGNIVGEVQVLDGEEVVDAVERFIRQTNITMDGIALKNYFFQEACGNKRVKCTRNIAQIFEKSINDKKGNFMGKIILMEQDEPSDVVFQFTQEKGLTVGDYQQIMDQVCSDELVYCKRLMPLVTSIPIHDPDGQYIGTFDVEVDIEPVDSLYRFFAKHGLFQRDWDFRGVLRQVCNLPKVACKRERAIKFHAESILMGTIDIGPLTIWEQEEVVDVLYKKRKELNLTVSEQMSTFGVICSRQEIHCGRTQAVIYELSGLTKMDFGKYGNETCARKYAGWQFLTYIASSSLGSKASTFMKHEVVVMSIGSPLFVPLVLLAICFVTHILFLQFTRYWNIHIGHKIVAYITILIVVALSQAIFIEPKGDIDQAMHLHEGRLPDIIVLENQEPVDVILNWGRLASKDHHPLVREPIYWDILAKVCSEIHQFQCKRLRAWEYIDMGSITISGQTHKIDYYNPEVEPIGRKICKFNGTVNVCIEKTAIMICSRIYPRFPQCLSDIMNHISTQMQEHEKRRLNQKDTYVKLGLEMDAPDKELFPRMAEIARKRGMNIVPYNTVGNKSAPIYHDWDTNTHEAYAVRDAFHKVRDIESREWNDKPCTPYFGGALCAKNDKDGNMIIEV